MIQLSLILKAPALLGTNRFYASVPVSVASLVRIGRFSVMRFPPSTFAFAFGPVGKPVPLFLAFLVITFFSGVGYARAVTTCHSEEDLNLAKIGAISSVISRVTAALRSCGVN